MKMKTAGDLLSASAPSDVLGTQKFVQEIRRNVCGQANVLSECAGEILWCDHSNETSSAMLSHCTV